MGFRENVKRKSFKCAHLHERGSRLVNAILLLRCRVGSCLLYPEVLLPIVRDLARLSR